MSPSGPPAARPASAPRSFAIRLNRLSRLLLSPFGVREGSAQVEIEDDRLLFTFGELFQEDQPLGEVSAVTRSSWPWWGGLGVRLPAPGPEGAQTVALIGSLEGIVAVRFRRPRRVKSSMAQVACAELRLSLEEPDAFVETMRPQE